MIYLIKTDDKFGIANTLTNIGSIYIYQAKNIKNKSIKDSLFNLAFKNYNKSLSIQTEMDNKKGMSGSYSNIASLYQNKATDSKNNALFKSA